MRGLTGPTVWSEFTPLAVQHGAYNLGQGFPDWPAPDFCKAAVVKAVQEDYNQYARGPGHPALVQVRRALNVQCARCRHVHNACLCFALLVGSCTTHMKGRACQVAGQLSANNLHAPL